MGWYAAGYSTFGHGQITHYCGGTQFCGPYKEAKRLQKSYRGNGMSAWAKMVLEEPTIDRMIKKSNKRMSNETRDLLKMGLSQGTIWAVAKSVYRKHGLPGIGVIPKGTSPACPICEKTLWEPKYGTKV